jgi:hypothetical protein
MSQLDRIVDDIHTPLKQRVEKALDGGPTSAYGSHDMPGFVAIVVDAPGFLNLVHLLLLHHDEMQVTRQYRIVENYQTNHYVLLVAKERGEN